MYMGGEQRIHSPISNRRMSKCNRSKRARPFTLQMQKRMDGRKHKWSSGIREEDNEQKTEIIMKSPGLEEGKYLEDQDGKTEEDAPEQDQGEDLYGSQSPWDPESWSGGLEEIRRIFEGPTIPRRKFTKLSYTGVPRSESCSTFW